MAKVSVVMPSLNVAKYIDECMSSVVQQTLEDIEIIAVDAGSTDGTLEILKKYQLKDERIKIINAEKRSYGYQMNLGISLASGEYIAIVETDDIIKAEMLQILYQTAHKEDADYVKGTAKEFYQTESGLEWDYLITPCDEVLLNDMVIVNPRENPNLFITDNFLWNGIYKSDFLKRIKFHETAGAAYQDISALFKTFISAKKAVYLNYPVYCHRQSNINASTCNKKSFQYVVSEFEYIQQFMTGLSDEWFKYYYLRLVFLSNDRMNFMVISGKYWEEACNEIAKLQEMILKGIQSRKISWNDCEMICPHFAKKFTQNAKEAYEEIALQFLQKNQQLKNLICKYKEKNFYIFGAGNYGRFLHVFLSLNGIDSILGFCDNNASKWGNYINNKKVFSIEDIENINTAYFIIAVSKHADEIKQQLLNLGVVEEKIDYFDTEADVLLLYDLTVND